ncbi:MAG: PA14 domain-containing protein [Desulfobacterales bacterium]
MQLKRYYKLTQGTWVQSRAALQIAIMLGMFLLLTLECAATESTLAHKVAVEPLAADPAIRSKGTDLKPGFSVRYYTDIFVRHIDKLMDHATGDPGRPGSPILQLNHQFERNPVFDSGSNRGVGMRLAGYLHFDTPGTYFLQALSNDGIRIYLGETQLLEDPGVHGDRLSPEGGVRVAQPGWYPLAIWYYQRKGTAALKLFWRPPGSEAMQIVPPEALAHLPQPRG